MTVWFHGGGVGSLLATGLMTLVLMAAAGSLLLVVRRSTGGPAPRQEVRVPTPRRPAAVVDEVDEGQFVHEVGPLP